MRTIFLLLGVVTCIGVQPSAAQIAITRSQVEAVLAAGNSLTVYAAPETIGTVNVGGTGGPNVYDFTSMSFPASMATTVYSVSAVPLLTGHYPGSAITFGQSPSFIRNTPVLLFSAETLKAIGKVLVTPDSQKYRHYFPHSLFAVFPATYGDTLVFTDNPGAGVETTYVGGVPVRSTTGWNSSGTIVYDGYGILRVAGHQQACLRMRSVEVPPYDQKKFLYVTQTGLMVLINTTSDQPDTGVVQTSGVFYVMPSTIAISVPVAVNWNIVSLPVSDPTSGDSVRQVYVNSSFPYGFAFVPGSGYQQRYIMQNGPGYWIKSTTAYNEDITGTPFTTLLTTVSAGWNMIGSRTTATDTSCVAWGGGASRASAFFEYSGGYVVTSSLTPGKGFWVKSNAAGTITLQDCPLGKPQAAPAGRSIEQLNSITIRDANGGMQTLYFGADPPAGRAGEIPVEMYAMPPVPPQGAFDARFTSSDGGRMVQTHAAEVSEAIEWPIAIQSSAYPLTVTWKVNGADAVYELRAGEDVVQTLTGEGTLRIGSEGLNRLTLRVVGGSALPKEYALWQNYPNPFNPTTNIKFALPVESKVSADVYNLLGQRVATLVNEVLPAGYHTMEWNGTGSAGQAVGSGVYFLRLHAKGANGETFTDVKKLLLLK